GKGIGRSAARGGRVGCATRAAGHAVPIGGPTAGRPAAGDRAALRRTENFAGSGAGIEQDRGRRETITTQGAGDSASGLGGKPWLICTPRGSKPPCPNAPAESSSRGCARN